MGKSVKNKKKIDWSQVKDFFQSEKTRIVTGILLLVISFYIFISLISFIISGDNDYNLLHHTLSDLSAEKATFTNAGSSLGAKIANLFINRWFET